MPSRPAIAASRRGMLCLMSSAIIATEATLDSQAPMTQTTNPAGYLGGDNAAADAEMAKAKQIMKQAKDLEARARATDAAAQSKLKESYNLEQNAKAKVAQANATNAKAMATMTKAKGMTNNARSKVSQAEGSERHAKTVEAAADSKFEKTSQMEERAKAESAHAQSDDVSAKSALKKATAFETDASAKLSQAKWFCALAGLLIAGPLLLYTLKQFSTNKAVSKEFAGAEIERPLLTDKDIAGVDIAGVDVETPDLQTLSTNTAASEDHEDVNIDKAQDTDLQNLEAQDRTNQFVLYHSYLQKSPGTRGHIDDVQQPPGMFGQFFTCIGA